MAARLQDIADAVGLSISTVSLAFREPSRISEETLGRIQSAAERLGYIHRPRLRARVDIKTMAFVMLYPPKEGFYSAVLNGAESECQRYGISLQYLRIDDHTPRALNQLEHSDSILAVGSIPEETILQLKALGRPMVLVDNNLPQTGLDRVLTENTHSVAASVHYLAGRGHRAIAFMRGLDGHPSFAERHAGYRAAMAELGLEPLELHCDHPDFHVRGGEVIGAWLDSHAGRLGFTALVVCNDDAAAGALNGLRARGLRVPEDVSVVGFDDNDIAAIVWPPLTTSHVHRELLGALGVRRLLERAAEPESPSIALTIDTTFVERQSVSLVPGS